jgi:hypothetical protein
VLKSWQNICAKAYQSLALNSEKLSRQGVDLGNHMQLYNDAATGLRLQLSGNVFTYLCPRPWVHTPTHTNTHTHTWNTDTALQIMKQVHLLTWNYKINKQSMIRRRMHEQEHSRERRVKEEYNTNDQTKVKEWETCACREGGSCPGILILSTSFLHSLLVNASC